MFFAQLILDAVISGVHLSLYKYNKSVAKVSTPLKLSLQNGEGINQSFGAIPAERERENSETSDAIVDLVKCDNWCLYLHTIRVSLVQELLAAKLVRNHCCESFCKLVL